MLSEHVNVHEHYRDEQHAHDGHVSMALPYWNCVHLVSIEAHQNGTSNMMDWTDYSRLKIYYKLKQTYSSCGTCSRTWHEEFLNPLLTFPHYLFDDIFCSLDERILCIYLSVCRPKLPFQLYPSSLVDYSRLALWVPEFGILGRIYMFLTRDP